MLCYEAEIWNNVSENPNACHLRSVKFRCSVFEHIEWDSCWNSLASRWSVSQKKTMSYSALLRWSDSVMNVLAWGPQIEHFLKCFLIHLMVLTIAVGFSSLFVSESFFFVGHKFQLVYATKYLDYLQRWHHILRFGEIKQWVSKKFKLF